MRYKNSKTGAIIDSLYKVTGGDWVTYDSKMSQKIVVEETPVAEQVLQETETLDEQTGNADFDSITKPQIMQELDAFGFKYDKRANKQVLYDLMMNHGQ
ncbi:hypothetical protein IGI37_002263 [Enterococcus sp. AZ194]|uniref:hypothetical protein n=1 Tax=Enterococcus sp. AZ194 TaxID=2774629 RepID=UPI003F25EA33